MDVLFNFRFSTEVTADELRGRTETILNTFDLDYQIEWNLSGQPFLTTPGALVDAAVASIKEIVGVDAQLSTTGGTSDGRFIAPYGAQVLELGPINASIHKLNEHVRSADLASLSAIYRAILERIQLRL